MRARLIWVSVLVVIAVGGCGTGDEDEPGPLSTPGPIATSPESPAEPERSNCPDRAPVEIEPPAGYEGFVRLCQPQFAKDLLVAENISNTVLVVDADPRRVGLQAFGPSKSSLAAATVHELGIPRCGGDWCNAPPGGRIDASGVAPVHVTLSVDRELTAAVALAASLASSFGGRFRTAGQRALDAAARCAHDASAAVTAGSWEESFRHALTGAEGCRSLQNVLRATEEPLPETSINRVIKRARGLSNGLWVDALLLGAKAVR